MKNSRRSRSRWPTCPRPARDTPGAPIFTHAHTHLFTPVHTHYSSLSSFFLVFRFQSRFFCYFLSITSFSAFLVFIFSQFLVFLSYFPSFSLSILFFFFLFSVFLFLSPLCHYLFPHLSPVSTLLLPPLPYLPLLPSPSSLTQRFLVTIDKDRGRAARHSSCKAPHRLSDLWLVDGSYLLSSPSLSPSVIRIQTSIR